MKENFLELLLTQVWFLMLGVSIGFAASNKAMWWLPVFIIGVLVVYRLSAKIYYKVVDNNVRSNKSR